jgi:hypothetical protein
MNRITFGTSVSADVRRLHGKPKNHQKMPVIQASPAKSRRKYFPPSNLGYSHPINPKTRSKMPIFQVEPTGTGRKYLRLVGLQPRLVTGLPQGPGVSVEVFSRPVRPESIALIETFRKTVENQEKQSRTNRNKARKEFSVPAPSTAGGRPSAFIGV